MDGRERVLALLAGAETDHLAAMPMTMMFAANHAGVPYLDYARDHRVLVRSQIKTATDFGFDHSSRAGS